MLPETYLDELSRIAKNKYVTRLEEVSEIVEKKGYWEENIEWRIFTNMKLRITKTDYIESERYEVAVKCDYQLTAHCPTIERALEFVGIYEILVMDMWRTFGWPSWKSKNESK